MSRKTLHLAVVALVAFGLLFSVLPSPALAADTAQQQPTLNVTGSGIVFTNADQARITFGVTTTGATAQAAQKENSQRLAKVISQLTASGVDKNDIQTVNFSIWPQYNYSEQEKGKPPVITGYTVENQVVVVLRDLQKMGNLIDLAITNGVNQVHSMQFFKGNDQAEKLQALQLAVKDARAKAGAMAQAMGVKIVGVVTASDNSSVQGPIFFDRAMGYGGGGGDVPVQPGQMQITATVNIAYLIQ